MDFKFYLNDIEIEEPVGFSDITFNISRDDAWHGVFFEATTSDLGFYGDAATILQTAKEETGIESVVVFRADYRCDAGDYQTAITGKLDFGQYRASCGNVCIITMPVENEGCISVLRNRYDQKVDIDSSVAFNKSTALVDYAGLDFELELPAKDLEARVEGYVQDGGEIVTYQVIEDPDSTAWGVNIRPSYSHEIYNSINQGELVPSSNISQGFAATGTLIPISPNVLFDDKIECFTGTFDYTARLKGRYSLSGNATGFEVRMFVARWNGVGDFQDFEILHNDDLYTGPDPYVSGTEYEFDNSVTDTVDLTTGQGIYVFLQVSSANSTPDDPTISIEYDQETYFTIYANKSCPSTTASVNLIHETLSRVTEAITDKCLTVKSDYYGRIDSEPYAALVDGCGGLRVVTSGLKIRKADNPTYFQSLRDLFDGLNGIDNIGMGVEGSELRIEPVEYFYQDSRLLTCDAIPSARFIVDEKYHYSIVKIGYKKWEVQNVNGLDEFNSNKEFRTGLSQVNNTLDRQSGLVAGSYPIEITRQQSFADSGGADTTYDNETFIICVERSGYAYGSYQVERNNILSPSGFYSPSTAYNWRIRPMYNLMRWWKSVAQSYTNLINTTSKLFFSAGTGNILASGSLGDNCAVEVDQLAENNDLYHSNIVDDSPIWKPERVEFTYPLSLLDYQNIKASPYGYVLIECNNTQYKGFIKSIQYRPARGTADFNLLLKYE